MQWRVSIGGHDQIVALPDNLPDNVPFEGTINGRQITLRWQKSTRSLYLLKPEMDNTWSCFNIRSVACNRFPGESDLNVSSEFIPPGARSAVCLESSVSLYIPGQESRTSDPAKKIRIIRSQITGKVLKVLVKPGISVASGDTLCIIEAMKMENKVLAATAGIVDQVKVNEGDMVSAGSEIARFKQG